MTISDSTQAILAAQEYTRTFMTLDEQGFIASLADNVSCVHSRVRDGVDFDTVELNGKKAVSDAYHKYFFAITSNFDLRSESYKGCGLQASIECDVDEDKNEGGKCLRYHMICRTQLNFEKDENGALKVIKIWERTSKDPI